MNAADATVEQILATQPHERWVVVDSPPGAGKTGTVERLLCQAVVLHDERVMVSTNTNQQMLDLARRVADNWPVTVCLHVRDGLPLPDWVAGHPRLTVCHQPQDIPSGPVAVVANSSKWGWWRGDDDFEKFDLLIVDEAYQLADHKFVRFSHLADRTVLVGDPGQIAPVVSASVDRWQHDPAGPHVPCPQALVHHHPDRVCRLALPVSRRLPADTVRVVQPAFYPQLPFEATSPDGHRRLHPGTDPGIGPVADAVKLLTSGVTLGMLELPPASYGEHDPQLAEAIRDVIVTLVGSDVTWEDHPFGTGTLTSADIGVVCGHRSQVQQVQELLPAACSDVLVETADRFQGLERKVMLVHHPLSGRTDVGEFHTNTGRLCVMLSRHRVACLVVSRAGLLDLVADAQPLTPRVPGQTDDMVHAGLLTHRTMLTLFEQENRVVGLQRSQVATAAAVRQSA